MAWTAEVLKASISNGIARSIEVKLTDGNVDVFESVQVYPGFDAAALKQILQTRVAELDGGYLAIQKIPVGPFDIT